MSWDHVNAVINYMVDKEGLSADRFIFNYGQDGGDCNTVDLRVAAQGEDGPNNVPPPHPNLKNILFADKPPHVYRRGGFFVYSLMSSLKMNLKSGYADTFGLALYQNLNCTVLEA